MDYVFTVIIVFMLLISMLCTIYVVFENRRINRNIKAKEEKDKKEYYGLYK